MRTSPISLQIPTPCAEPWAAMTPRGAGRHCASCQKVVIDFTQKTDAEILALLKSAAAGGTCGRFQGNQLNRALRQPEAPRSGWWSTAVAATVALLLGRSLVPAQARAQTATSQHPPAGRHSAEPEFWQPAQPVLAPPIKGEVAEAVGADDSPRTSISGVVVDQQTGQGLPGVTVLLQGTQHGVSTNADGSFTLAIEPTEQHHAVQASSIGYESVVLPQPQSNRPLKFQMPYRATTGLLVVYRPIYTPQGLWSRLRSLPYRVGALFR